MKLTPLGLAALTIALLAASDAAAIEAHMAYLASDGLEGRETGTPGYDLAADYVAAEFAKIGFANGGDAAFAEHQAKNYHRPSDDMSNNLDFNAAARFAELNARITLALANQDVRPLWKKDDFFARQFNGPMEP